MDTRQTVALQTKFHPYTFERVRGAVLEIAALRPLLTSAEAETLALLLDEQAMKTIEKSAEEADTGNFESLKTAVAS